MRRGVPLLTVYFLLLAVVLSPTKAESERTAVFMFGLIRQALGMLQPMNLSTLQHGIVTRMALTGQS
ncbi:MAG: hypothetical protein Q8N00_14530 [Nitrospirota bacterium]|nr:hypothetical protein [Nitrospirota bacterium]MDP3596090.1 hypothetical protein [Nitrospirota bacterium]